jgi:NAD+ synthase (glutamine-hydrolysing)
MYVEKKMSADQIVQEGYPRDLVIRILNTIDRMEYKRRQAPPPLKITSHTLGFDGKLPLVQRFSRR